MATGFGPRGKSSAMRNADVSALPPAPHRYDSDDRVTSVEGAITFFSQTYALAADGSKTTIVERQYDTATGTTELWTSTESLAYDNLDRVTADTLTYSNGVTPTLNYGYTKNYSYDAVGNRTQMIATSGGVTDTVGYSYDARDRLTTETHSAGGGTTIVYAYSSGGNLLTKTTSGATTATESFTYDDRNRMLSDTVAGVSTNSYSYNDQGDQTALNTTQMVWDDYGISGYSQELDENGMGMASGPMGVNVQYNTSLGYLMSDGHGSTRFVTDASGNPQTTYLYDAFGGQLNPAATGVFATNVLYTGQYFRPGGGSLYDLRPRMYDSEAGRFLSIDSTKFDPGHLADLNLYLYVGDNPLTLTDPSGHFSLPELLTAIALGSLFFVSSFSLPGCGRGSSTSTSSSANGGLTGPAYAVTSGNLLGGYNVNSYLNGALWAQLAVPGSAGAEGISSTAYFKVQLVAPYNGPSGQAGVLQTMTCVNANQELLDSLSSYVNNFGLGSLSNGVTINEPLLGSDPYNHSQWFPLYTKGYVTFADVPGGFSTGSRGDVRFETTFYDHKKQSGVVWTLHVDFTAGATPKISVTQDSQSFK